MKVMLLFLFTTVLFAGCKAPGENAIKEIIADYYKNGTFNGAILIAKEGKIIFDTAAGYKDLQKKSAIGRHTSFYIASITKPSPLWPLCSSKCKRSYSMTILFPFISQTCQHMPGNLLSGRRWRHLFYNSRSVSVGIGT